MSDHEFERQVRQKLNNLKLPPSPETWERIEDRIRERKRRRAPLLWLPLVIGGLVAGGYLIDRAMKTPPVIALADTADQTNHKHQTYQAAAGKPQTVPPAATGAAKDHPQEVADNAMAPLAAAASPATTGAAIAIAPASTTQHSAHQTKAYRSSLPIRNRHTAPGPIIAPGAKRSSAESAEELIPETADVASAWPDRTSTAPDTGMANVAASAVTEKPIGEPQASASEKPSAAAEITAKTKAAATPAVPKKSAVATVNSKWSYAVTAYSGIVAVNEGGLFSFNRPKVEDVSYMADFQNASLAFAPQAKPSTISPGLGFSAGLEVKRELSSRLSLSLGISYAQFNTRSKVGERVNSSQIVNNGTRGYLYVPSYYLLDPNENLEYRNRYHFIELPLTLHARINNSARLPLYWNGGMVVSRLLSSTSLHYDGTTGVYYKNDRLLTQTQVGVTTGFSLVLFNKTAHPIWIGPWARSNISTILKKDVSASKHFVTLGLDMKFFLKK